MRPFFVYMLFFLMLSRTLLAQQGISMQFKTSNTTESVNGLARNGIKILNATNNTYPFLLEFKAPAKWKIIGLQSKTFILAPHDSIFIPIYLMPFEEVQGGEIAVLGAQLFSDGYMVSSDNWVLQIDKLTNWHVVPSSNQIYFLHQSDTAELAFNIINNGNADEEITFDLNAFRDKVKLYDLAYDAFETQSYLVKSGEDTTVHFLAVINESFKGESSYNTLEKKPSTKIYNVKAQAHNNAQDRLYAEDKENITLRKVTDNFKDQPYSTASLPMVLQMDAYNILENSTYLSLQAYGNKTIKDVNELSYFYQTNFNSNVLDGSAFLGDYFYLGYIAPNYYGELGNIVLNNEGASVSGKGIRGGYTLGNHRFGGGVVASPSINNIDKWGASAYYEFKYKPYDMHTSFYSFYEENNYNHQRNITLMPEGQWRINRQHLIRVMGGYNFRTYMFDQPSHFSQQGFGTRLSYSGRIKGFSLSATGRYGSPTYEPSPGILQLTGIGGYYHANGWQSRLLISHFSSRPKIYDVLGNLVLEGLRSRTNQAEYKVSSSDNVNTLTSSAYVRERLYNSLQMLNEGLSFSYYRRLDGNRRVTSTVNADINQFPDIPNIGSFFTARLKTSLRIKENLLFNVRYHYGPFYYYEFKEYAESSENPQTIFFNGYYDRWFANNKLLARISGNYNYRLNREQHIFNSRPEMFWYTDNGFRFSVYGNVSYFSRQQQVVNQTDLFITTSSSNFELGFGIRKELGLPVSRKRFFDLSVKAFYDANGNGKMDRSEKKLSNVLITLIPEADKETFMSSDRYQALTSKKGEALCENLIAGHYSLLVEKLTPGDGFYNNSITDIDLVQDRELILAFTSGGKVMGTLQVQKAQYSRFEEKDVELANIRIVVKDNNGHEYSTLTDANGFFSVEIPGGHYTVSVNSAVFGASFSVQNNDVKVEINDNKNSVFVNFLVSETERKINIKRFDNNENTP